MVLLSDCWGWGQVGREMWSSMRLTLVFTGNVQQQPTILTTRELTSFITRLRLALVKHSAFQTVKFSQLFGIFLSAFQYLGPLREFSGLFR